MPVKLTHYEADQHEAQNSNHPTGIGTHSSGIAQPYYWTKDVQVYGHPDQSGGCITVNTETGDRYEVVSWRKNRKGPQASGTIGITGEQSLWLFDTKLKTRLEIESIPVKQEVRESPRAASRAVIRMYRSYYDPEWGPESVIEQTFHVQPGHQWSLNAETFVYVTPAGVVEIVKIPQDSEEPPQIRTLTEEDYVQQTVVDNKGPLTIIIEPEIIGEKKEN